MHAIPLNATISWNPAAAHQITSSAGIGRHTSSTRERGNRSGH
jgi:hypothetical protein